MVVVLKGTFGILVLGIFTGSALFDFFSNALGPLGFLIVAMLPLMWLAIMLARKDEEFFEALDVTGCIILGSWLFLYMIEIAFKKALG